MEIVSQDKLFPMGSILRAWRKSMFIANGYRISSMATQIQVEAQL